MATKLALFLLIPTYTAEVVDIFRGLKFTTFGEMEWNERLKVRVPC